MSSGEGRDFLRRNRGGTRGYREGGIVFRGRTNPLFWTSSPLESVWKTHPDPKSIDPTLLPSLSTPFEPLSPGSPPPGPFRPARLSLPIDPEELTWRHS